MDHSYGRKWRRNKEPLDESQRGEWKSWLKTKFQEKAAKRKNKDWLKPTRSKMVEDLTSGVPWASLYAHCNALASKFWGLQNHWDGDCSHEIKGRLLLGRKVMTNLDSILKSRDITLPTKVRLVKAMVFLVVMYGCELDYKESWVLKNWCFWNVVLGKPLESPLDSKELKPLNPKS